MNAQELVKLLESGDLYGLMLATVREWVRKHHPSVHSLTLVGDFGREEPAIQLPIKAEVSASSRSA